MKKNKRIKTSSLLFLIMVIFFSCSEKIVSQKTKNFTVKTIFDDWQRATYKSAYNNLDFYLNLGVDSLSLVTNTFPIFEKYITQSRSECFSKFIDSGYNPFLSFYHSNYIIIEIFREDNCNTKVMHIIETELSNFPKKEWAFIRNCKNKKTILYQDTIITESILPLVNEFKNTFNFKGGINIYNGNYTGVLSYIKKGKFTCFPLLYLSDEDILRLNEIGMGGLQNENKNE